MLDEEIQTLEVFYDSIYIAILRRQNYRVGTQTSVVRGQSGVRHSAAEREVAMADYQRICTKDPCDNRTISGL